MEYTENFLNKYWLSYPFLSPTNFTMPQSKIITITCFSLLLISVVAEPQFPCFFIFGDSLVDNGNNNYLNTTAKVNYLPYGVDFPAGPTGRFSNGRNIADVLSQKLGFEKSIPPFVNVTDEDIVVGVNYGSGGAGILDETGSHNGDVITLNEQLSNHEVAISRLVTYLGRKRAAKNHLKSCLYYVGMGDNDYLGNYLPKYYAPAAPEYTPQQFSTLLIKRYSKQLRRLYYNGARKIAVLALGQLGCIPQQISTYGSNSSACVETTNDIVRLFNEKLGILIKGLNILFPNAKFVYTTDLPDNMLSAMLEHSSTVSNIVVVDKPCCPVSAESEGYCVEGEAICKNRDEYYFWDWYHPSEAAVLLSADVVYDAISPLFTTHLVDVW